MTVVSVPVLCVPLPAFVPVQSPEAVHEGGLPVLLQLNVALPLTSTDDGLAVMATVGAFCRT